MNSEAIQEKSFLDCRVGNKFPPRNDALSGSFRLPFTIYRLPRFAFTLAEVLITLTVIGVVSALTIPALINSYQTQVYITKYKKAFSTLNQAATRVMDDNGGDFMNVCTGTYASPNGSDCLQNKFANYLSVAKSCPNGNILGNCWSSTYYAADGQTPFVNATNTNNWDSGLILNDGTSILFEERSSACGDTLTNLQGETKYRCGIIYIDTNGFKLPNTFGKDIFSLYMVSDKIVPRGALGYKESSTSTCPQNSPGNAGTITSCAADYLGQ